MPVGSLKEHDLLDRIIVLISRQDQLHRKEKAKLSETWFHKIAWDVRKKIDNKQVRESIHFYWYIHGPFSEPIKEKLHTLAAAGVLKKEPRGSQSFYMLQTKPSINDNDPTTLQLIRVIDDTLKTHDLYNLDGMIKEVYEDAPLKFQPIFRFGYLQDIKYYKELLFDVERNEKLLDSARKIMMKGLYNAEANLPTGARFEGFRDIFSEYVGGMQVIIDLYGGEDKEFIMLSSQTAALIWETFACGLRMEKHDSYYDFRMPQWEKDFENALSSMKNSVNSLNDLVSKNSKKVSGKELEPLDQGSQELLDAIIQGYDK